MPNTQRISRIAGAIELRFLIFVFSAFGFGHLNFVLWSGFQIAVSSIITVEGDDVMKRLTVFLVPALIILMPVLAACSSGGVSAAQANAIGKKLNCVCGSCSENVTDCALGPEGCATSPKQMALIKKGLAAGNSEEQIIRNMASVYGQRALIK
jgi:hypothetical protein